MNKRLALIETEIARFEGYLAEMALADTKGKSVLMFPSNGLCINSAGTVGGVMFAEVYTDETLANLASWEMGLPSYRNGNGEAARLVSLASAVAFNTAEVGKVLATFREMRDAEAA